MTVELGVFAPGRLEILRRLLSDPSLAPEFEALQGPQGLERVLADPFSGPELRWLAFRDGEPAGFCWAFVIPTREGSFAMLRPGVVARARRTGIGSRLIETASAAVRELAPQCRELCLTAWVPSPEAAGFAARHGYEHARFYWLMERPQHGSAPQVDWPPGVEVETFDGTERALGHWSEAYNRSFAEHYHGALSTPESVRALAAVPGFRPDGVLLARRTGACVGFCQNQLLPGRGEVATLGVVPEARGIGLGRALLRWGVGWLEHQAAPRVTLTVDGENEGALSLYRSEGFETVRKREIWSRRLP